MDIYLDDDIIEEEFEDWTDRKITEKEKKELQEWFETDIYEWIKDNVKSFVEHKVR